MSIDLHTILRFETWANARLIAHLRMVSAPPPRVLEVMAHIARAQQTWLDRIAGLTEGHELFPEVLIATIAEEHERTARDLAGLLESRAPSRLDDAVTYHNTKGDTYTTPIRDILLHLALHGPYHRGQVNQLLRQAGAPVCAIDYIVYQRETSA